VSAAAFRGLVRHARRGRAACRSPRNARASLPPRRLPGLGGRVHEPAGAAIAPFTRCNPATQEQPPHACRGPCYTSGALHPALLSCPSWRALRSGSTARSPATWVRCSSAVTTSFTLEEYRKRMRRREAASCGGEESRRVVRRAGRWPFGSRSGAARWCCRPEGQACKGGAWSGGGEPTAALLCGYRKQTGGASGL